MRALQDGGAYATAASMAQSIAVNVLSQQAENLTDPIFASLGIQSSSTTTAAYFAQVQTALTAIEGDLDKVMAKLTALSDGVGAIENALTAISSQITDAELQAALVQYAENANLISQNYQSFAAAIAGMGSAATFEQGTSALFDLFQETNVDAVATALRNIHDQLAGAGELRGIISYQTLEVEREWNAMAVDPTQVSRTNWDPDHTGGWVDTFPDGALILEGLPTVLTTAFGTTIIPLFKAAMAIELKGLHFLCAAWGGTINVDSLQTHTDDIGDIVTAMNGVFALFDFETMGADVLQKSGPRLPSDALSADWLNDAAGTFGPPPFDTTWLFWNAGRDFPDQNPPSVTNWWQAGVVQTPWNYGDLPSTVISSGYMGAEVPPGSGNSVDTYYQFYSPVTVTITAPTATAPANLTTFLATLPAAPVSANRPAAGGPAMRPVSDLE